jgi:hypothetical protein
MILRNHFAEFSYEYLSDECEQVDWLQSSPEDSLTMQLKKQLYRDRANLDIRKVVEWLLTQWDKKLAAKFDDSISIINKSAEDLDFYRDRSMPMKKYLQTLVGGEQLSVEKNDDPFVYHFFACNIYVKEDWRSPSLNQYFVITEDTKDYEMFPVGLLYLEPEIVRELVDGLIDKRRGSDWPNWYKEAIVDLAGHYIGIEPL